MRRRKGVVRIATCQFPVSADIRRNAQLISRQIDEAADAGADIVHLPECALCGYPSVDFSTWDGFDWNALLEASHWIASLAAKRRVWVVFGSSHRLTGRHMPHNSLYVINPNGLIACRYDKRFCTPGDLMFFSPGDHFTTFDLNGVRFGLLICHDLRYPELYREYLKLGTNCILQSFYNAREKGPGPSSYIMRPTLQCHAASNYFWLSANNASAYYQRWPSVFILPDGKIHASLRIHRAGVMVNEIDLSKKYYDASRHFRSLAVRGILNTGKLVKDRRSAVDQKF